MLPRIISNIWLWWSDSVSFRTLFLINVAAIVERADEALLPAVYREVGHAFSATPSGLGALTLARALSQALSFPMAAYLAQTMDRTKIIALGAVVWGVATSAVGFATSYWQMVAARVLNGVGLAMVIPAIQSIVADSSKVEKRGQAFGWLSLTGNAGSILGGMFGILLAGNNYGGVAGWRMAFHLTAVISYLLAYLVYRFAVDPTSRVRQERLSQSPYGIVANLWELWTGAKQVMRGRTFQIIVAQGIVGSFPWAAMAFSAMWLELIGFTNTTTAILLGSFSVFNALGALFGGFLGDRMAILYPDSGRIICAQISSGVAVPLSAILLRTIPPDTKYVYVYSAVLTIMGFLISWNSASTNNPIFAEIVPEHLRTSIYALDRTFEMSVAAFAPPTVGYLAENVYGYIPPSKVGQNSTTMEANNVSNSVALSRGLFTTIAIPFLVCCAIYSFLYCTYPRDRDLIRLESMDAGLGHVRLSPLHSLVDNDEIVSLTEVEQVTNRYRLSPVSTNGSTDMGIQISGMPTSLNAP